MEFSHDFIPQEYRAPVIFFDDSQSPEPINAVLALGVFDGVHLGHQHLLRAAILDAHNRGVKAVAVTFVPDPDELVSANPAQKLMDTTDRLRALSHTGVDAVYVVSFTPELAAFNHVSFFDKVIGSRLNPLSIHLGRDARLGRAGTTNLDALKRWGATRGIAVVGHQLVEDSGAIISSTRIRRALQEGHLEEAERLLGRNYVVRGSVVRGRGEGTAMGFPTANIARAAHIQLPKDGVYAGYALTEQQGIWPAAINVGVPPMFADNPDSASLEATLLGFSGDLYNQQLSICFMERIRASYKFSSIDELIHAVQADMTAIRDSYGEAPIN
ncbi:riboflavin biosynthesis protein RibF [Collinsella sp. zg1085]|uniref:riboflavin biosynthesis protein RibF n=1 Tax=Collinsella sp. zg1085 TaxID=2844380 RepID=UPI001C0DC2D6|nr:riboflavin biosynthesis protein RibF [Collinsella sp. zg1085]QWT16962.1 riboflavin biosynthesis protein RibF [Collinsella sp. zg1085]